MLLSPYSGVERAQVGTFNDAGPGLPHRLPQLSGETPSQANNPKLSTCTFQMRLLPTCESACHGRDFLIKRPVSHGLMARISIGWQDLESSPSPPAIVSSLMR